MAPRDLVPGTAANADPVQGFGRAVSSGLAGQISTRLAPALVVLAGMLVFAPVVSGYFLSDDFGLVSAFVDFRLADIPRLFAGDWSMGIWGENINEYRPLWGVSFIADLWLWGPDPRALHLTSIALHASAAGLVWALAAQVTSGNARAAGLAVAFFVVAPVHDEAVAWIAARGHIMVTIFVIGAILLLRRYEQLGQPLAYAASIAAAVAAFATIELAVSLPGLLLFRDVFDGPRLTRQRVRQLATLHAPFWSLLVAYLALRLFLFGGLSPAGSAQPVSGPAGSLSALVDGLGLPQVAKAVREVARLLSTTGQLWTSATPAQDSPPLLVMIGATALVALITGPLLVLHGDARRGHARQIAFFAVCWPLLTTAPLLGQHAPHHFYLASVGLCVTLGLAGAHLAAQRSLPGLLAYGLIGAVLVGHTLSLAGGIAAFARNGQRSWQLKTELDRVLRRSDGDRGVLVVLPEMPTEQWFWEHALPFAARPPFRDRTSVGEIIPSNDGYCCPDWDAAYGPAVERLARDGPDPIYILEWDRAQMAFATRMVSPAEFRQTGYTRPGGPLAVSSPTGS